MSKKIHMVENFATENEVSDFINGLNHAVVADDLSTIVYSLFSQK